MVFLGDFGPTKRVGRSTMEQANAPFFHVRLTVLASFTIMAMVVEPTKVWSQTLPDDGLLNGLNPALLSDQGTLGTSVLGDDADLDDDQEDEDDQADGDQDDDAAVRQTGGVPLPAIPPTPGGSVAPEAPEPEQQQQIGRAAPIQGIGAQTSDPAPFDPLGIQVGRFLLRPAFDVNSGYTSNSTNDVTGSGSAFVSVNPSVSLTSDFNRHEVALQVDAGIDRFASGDDPSDLEVIATLNGRLDLTEETTLTGTINYAALEDDLTGIADDPLEITTTGTVQLDQQFDVVETSAAIRVVRNTNGDFVDAAGVLVDQEDLNSTTFGGTLRGTLRTNSSIEPFIEGDVAREIFDEEVDEFGNGRSLVSVRGLVGVEIDRGEKLSGEFGVGYGQNIFDPGDIENFGAFLAEFNIDWSPQRLTNVIFNGSTTFDAFPSLATPGDTTYTLNVDVNRELRENLTLTTGSGLVFQVDGGDSALDTTVNARAGLAYGFTRHFDLALDYNFARQFTSDGLADFTANTITLGVRAER